MATYSSRSPVRIGLTDEPSIDDLDAAICKLARQISMDTYRLLTLVADHRRDEDGALRFVRGDGRLIPRCGYLTWPELRTRRAYPGSLNHLYLRAFT